MKRLLLVLLFLFSYASLSAQDCPHFSDVLNVYRRDKSAIDKYAKEFITQNQDLFLYKQLAYLSKSDLEAPKDFSPYRNSDSGIIANAIYVHHSDTIYATVGLLSKNNRTQIILLTAKNYRNDDLLQEFLQKRIDDIVLKYHSFLKSKNKDTENW